jgi:hypothetical protein
MLTRREFTTIRDLVESHQCEAAEAMVAEWAECSPRLAQLVTAHATMAQTTGAVNANRRRLESEIRDARMKLFDLEQRRAVHRALAGANHARTQRGPAVTS